ncbi:MAG: hypothetical protein K2Q22_06135, partial [Cytophagales bacterium]|nr:hypothetical protein [Cytophagales bacterium]
CLRTQVMQLCSSLGTSSASKFNFEYKAGSIDGLLRFVKANRGATLVPLLATLDFSEIDKKNIKKFIAPVPFRSVGIVVHRHFVKKKLLTILKKMIQHKVEALIPSLDNQGNRLNPRK